MSAHAKLAAMTAARAAMTELLARIGMPDAPVEQEWRRAWGGDVEACYLRAQVPIADEPVNGATRVVAEIVAMCPLGEKAVVTGLSKHLDKDGWVDFSDLFRFDLPSGKGFMAPRTLARMVLAAMKKEEVGA